MARQRKYSEELRELATRMALGAIACEGKRMVVNRRIAGRLDIHPVISSGQREAWLVRYRKRISRCSPMV